MARAALLTLALLPVAPSARAEAPSEYQVKAAYLYNFLAFAEGAPEKGSEAAILVVGEDPFGDAFRAVEGRPVGPGRKPLAVRKVRRWSSGVDLSGVRLVFLASSEQGSFQQVLGTLAGRPILTIADSPGFLEAGGMINLVTRDRKIRWEVNRVAVHGARLRLSVQVLRNAVRVLEEP